MAWHKAITHQFGTDICDIDLRRQPLKLHLVQIWESYQLLSCFTKERKSQNYFL